MQLEVLQAQGRRGVQTLDFSIFMTLLIILSPCQERFPGINVCEEELMPCPLMEKIQAHSLC